MTNPIRITLSRRKGWRMPPNTVKVCRPGKWGNPCRVGSLIRVWHLDGDKRKLYLDIFHVNDNAHAVRLFEHAMSNDPHWYLDQWTPPNPEELRGKNVACWCKPGEPCHGDVLLRLANQ